MRVAAARRPGSIGRASSAPRLGRLAAFGKYERGRSMTLRAQAAIVGIGELPTRRTYPGRTTVSLMAEVAHLALEDAGLRKEDLDGVVTNAETVNPLTFAEYIQVQPAFCEGATLHGASGAQSIAIAAAAI